MSLLKLQSSGNSPDRNPKLILDSAISLVRAEMEKVDT